MLGHQTFYILRQTFAGQLPTTTTVLNEAPLRAQELGSFSDPNQAVDFAQTRAFKPAAKGLSGEYPGEIRDAGQADRFVEIIKRSTMMLVFLCLLAAALSPLMLFAQGTTAITSGTANHDALPAWGRPGLLRVNDWMGGPIWSAQCTLLGLPGFFEANPRILYAETTRYDPRTVDLLERAHINWALVVWSGGFSNESERVQQDLLRVFMAECHRRGIHVTAYLSVSMMAVEDMIAHVSESRTWVLEKDGQPVPYGAAGDYKKVGRITYYMADLRKQSWQEETLHRALGAVEAGADGVYFDNNFPNLYGPGGPELMGKFKARVLAEGRKRNPHLIVTSNYHASSYFLARYENSVNAEDGIEPGVFHSDARGEITFQESHTEVAGIPVKDGRLILNAGLLRIVNAVSEGWRPAWVNYASLHVGDVFSDVFPPAHQKLAMAECRAFHTAYESLQNGKTYSDLFFGEKNAVENWEAIRLYNSFFKHHELLYTSPVSMAGTAVVINSESERHDLAFLNRLAARNVIYDVVYEHDASQATLSRYAVIIAAPSVRLRPGWRRYEAVPPAEIEAASPARIAAPDSVIANVHGQSNTKHVLVHLLNYGDTPVAGIKVTVRGHFERGLILSPDKVNANLRIRPAGEFTQILIPELKIYDLLIL